MADFTFSDIEDAFLFVSSGPYGESSAYIDVETGRVYYLSDAAGIDDVTEEGADWENLIEIPHKNDLDLGKPLVLEFTSLRLPNEYDRVRTMFSKPGAYGRFKDFLESKGLLEAWYEFENEREKEAIRFWCEENKIELSD